MHQSALLSLLSVALTTVNASPALEARDPTRSCAGFNEGQTVRLGPSQYIVTCNTNYGPEDMYDARRIEGLDLQGCIQRCSQFPISQCKVPVSDGQTCWHKIPGSEPQGLHTGLFRVIPSITRTSTDSPTSPHRPTDHCRGSSKVHEAWRTCCDGREWSLHRVGSAAPDLRGKKGAQFAKRKRGG